MLDIIEFRSTCSCSDAIRSS